MELVNFNFKDKEVRTINQNGEPWFIAKDVTDILGYKNTTDALSKHVLEGERASVSLGRQGNTNIINESGMYALVLKSRKKEAISFRQWVTCEVLPDIRKHGLYATNDVINKTLNDPDLMISLLTEYKEAKLQLQQAQPLIEFANSIGTSAKSISFDTYAKLLANDGIDIGRNRLFALLRKHDYLIKSGEDKNNPKQKYIEQGLFEVKESVTETVKGIIPTKKTLITGKGQIYFLNKIKELLVIESAEVAQS
ncbi:BRO family protein [Pseudofrancisella aestuarii]|uniref:BRO family protein n=1 Tax=Pseudofrancisella aestuarii TaxID=2670347 RepID=A0ABV9TDE3_9GAMM|nr:phage antirepressor [Pseudofrancisella aestuarii]